MFEVNHVATVFLLIAIIHTFSVKKFAQWALRYPEGSVGENFFHLLAEVEVVFGLWAGVFSVFYLISEGSQDLLRYLDSLNFTEPIFVFVIMTLCSSRPVLQFCSLTIFLVSKLIPLPKGIAFYLSVLILGPILGSFITEPAAMTVTALILLENLYSKKLSDKLKYATLGLLFVNISIGGTLTHFAAPPVLMVASKWQWNTAFMFSHFGWKAILSCVISTSTLAYFFRRELKSLQFEKSKKIATPVWVIALHLFFLSAVVLTSHHTSAFIPLFLFFLGVAKVTNEYQDELKIKEGLLVAFFLGGLVVLGGLQRWWLEPLIGGLGSLPLYLGATSLTAITDNAALTYLGSQIPTLADSSKYALVAGAVVGGGLTVIANAPNPAGYTILNSKFGNAGISPLNLFLGALFPTFIALICFWFL